MRENAFQQRVLRLLRERGGEWVTYPRTRFAIAGVSDILGCYRGRFVAIELKRPDVKSRYGATATQSAFIRRINRAGGWAFVANSWDTIADALDAIDVEALKRPA